MVRSMSFARGYSDMGGRGRQRTLVLHQEGGLVTAIRQVQEKRGGSVDMECVNSVEVENLDNVTGVEVTGEGDILVVGWMLPGVAPCIEVFNPDGHKKPKIPLETKDTLLMDVCLWHDNIYVTCGRERNVVKINKYAKKQDVLELPEAEKKYPFSPLSVTANRVGDVFLSSQAANVLYHCRRRSHVATVCTRLAGDKYLSKPYYICLTPQDDLVVTSRDNFTVGLCTMPGGRVRHVYGIPGTSGSGRGQLGSPHGVCSDAAGHVYVADWINRRVAVLSPRLEFITHLLGWKEHGILGPQCLAVSPDGHFMVIVDTSQYPNILSIYRASRQQGSSTCYSAFSN